MVYKTSSKSAPGKTDDEANVTSTTPKTRAKARIGKKAIVGYYSPELSKTLRHLSVDEGVSIQALIGEALDMLLENRGLMAAGER